MTIDLRITLGFSDSKDLLTICLEVLRHRLRSTEGFLRGGTGLGPPMEPLTTERARATADCTL